MTVTKPYGTLNIVLDYIKKVNGLKSDTVSNMRNTITNEADLMMEVDPTVGIDDNYKFRAAVNDWTDLKVACRLHLMFGDPLDAQYYCVQADKLEADIIAKDPNLAAVSAGHIGVPKPKTYPSNPDGIHIIGNRRPTT